MSGTNLSVSAGFKKITFLMKPVAKVVLVILALFLVTLASCALDGGSSSSRSGKIPVIFDTDICDDIDDTWALGFLLKCPELDVKLITTTSDNTPLKARLIAKFLEIVNMAGDLRLLDRLNSDRKVDLSGLCTRALLVTDSNDENLLVATHVGIVCQNLFHQPPHMAEGALSCEMDHQTTFD